MRFLSLLITLCMASHSLAATEIKISTLYPPGSAAVKSLKEASLAISEATDGEVKLKVYPGGVMGDDNTVLRKMRIGQLQGALVSGTALDIITPNLKDIGHPFQFDSLDKVFEMREIKDDVFRERLADLKWQSYGPIDGGFSYLMSKQPIQSLDDIRESKIWLPNTKNIQAIANDLDVSYLVMNIGDVLTGLDTGAIDTIVAPPAAAITLNWHSRFAYYTDTPVIYTWGILILPDRSLKKIPIEYRGVVDDILTTWSTTLDKQLRVANQEAARAIQELLAPESFNIDDINLLRNAQLRVENN